MTELFTKPGQGSATAGQAASFPHAGDLLVFEKGRHGTTTINAPEIIRGESPVLAWAMEPVSRTIRDSSRFNQILLVRLDPAHRVPFAADGIVGFSAICTHAGCVVSGWKPIEEHFLCPCHGSVYDPAACGRVVAGPAPRPLPALPLQISNDVLSVAAGFTAHIGGSTGRTD